MVTEDTETTGQVRSRTEVYASWYLALLEEVPGLDLGLFDSMDVFAAAVVLNINCFVWNVDDFPKDVCAGHSPDLLPATPLPALCPGRLTCELHHPGSLWLLAGVGQEETLLEDRSRRRY